LFEVLSLVSSKAVKWWALPGIITVEAQVSDEEKDVRYKEGTSPFAFCLSEITAGTSRARDHSEPIS
jgi:hypothetical protein